MVLDQWPFVEIKDIKNIHQFSVFLLSDFTHYFSHNSELKKSPHPFKHSFCADDLLWEQH